MLELTAALGSLQRNDGRGGVVYNLTTFAKITDTNSAVLSYIHSDITF